MTKKLFTYLISAFVTLTLWAQSPEKMSYQALVRDGSNNLLTSASVGMQISILQGSADGTAVYVERQFPGTNSNGLVSIEIGTGTVVSGNFGAIDWANGPYFIKTETDINGGANYTISGTSQLLSVPYALHSKTAESITGGIEESDPLFAGSHAAGINESDIANLANLSGTNTGDQDLSALASKTALGDSTAQLRSEIPDVSGFLTSESDPSVPTGTQMGQMQYWDGTKWHTVQAGGEGQMLSFVGGVPTWINVSGITKGGPTDVYNPATRKIWMDRNLGASKVATSSNDAAAYGDLYQWGRGTDGHEKRNSASTTTLSSSISAGHAKFILVSGSPYDWLSPQNDNLWQGTNGINNPCPSGYRLPTEAEWEAERTSWSSNGAAGAFASPLKLPVAGYRSYSNGLLKYVGFNGYYRSSTVFGNGSRILAMYSTNALLVSYTRAVGLSVRCIKD